MRRALLAPAIAWAAACSSADRPPAASSPPAAPGLVAEAQPIPPCQPVRLPIEGLSACMPGEPEEKRDTYPAGSAHGFLAELRAGPATAHFLAERLIADKRPAPVTSVPELSHWSRVDVSRELSVDGFPARLMDGIDGAGAHTTVEMVAAGNSVYVAKVERPPDAQLDPRVVDAFIASLRVDLAWRIHASPVDHFTVAVPEQAIVAASDKAPGGGMPRKMTSFALGGRDDVAFLVAVAPVPPGANRTADELLDGAVKAFAGQPSVEVLKARDAWSGSLRGREIVLRDAGGTHAHLRFFLTATRLYVVGIQGKSADAVSGADAQRFFESFQVAG